MRKKIKRWSVAILSLVVIVLVGWRFVLTKNYLVRVIEQSINSRVEISHLDISLWGFPAEVKLSGVKLAKRDGLAERGVAHDDRPKLEHAAITLDDVEFSLSLWELVFRKMDVDRLEVNGLHAAVVMYEDGSNSLDPLFSKPKKKDKKPKSSGGFNAKENKKLVTELREVVIRDGKVDLLLEESGLIIQVSDVNLDLSDIKVDPNALEVVNEATLMLGCWAEIYSNEQEKVKFGEIGLNGSARVRLFDPVSGEIDPDLEVDLVIDESSYVSSRVPYVNALRQLGEKVSQLGVKMGDFPDRASFSEPRKLEASYQKGRVDLHQSLGILLAEWEVALAKGCWFASGNEMHEFHAHIRTTEKVGGVVNELLGKLSQGLRDEMEQDWFVDGKLTMKIKSKGKLSSPKIRLENEIPDFKKLLKDKVKTGLLDFALDQLEGDDADDQEEPRDEKKDKKEQLKSEAGDLLRSLIDE